MGGFPSHHSPCVTAALRHDHVTYRPTHTTLFIEAISLSPTHNQQIGHGIACSFRLMKEERGMALAAATDQSRAGIFQPIILPLRTLKT